MRIAIGLVLAVAGFVAAIFAPPGLPLLAAFVALPVGAALLAVAWLDLIGEP